MLMERVEEQKPKMFTDSIITNIITKSNEANHSLDNHQTRKRMQSSIDNLHIFCEIMFQQKIKFKQEHAQHTIPCDSVRIMNSYIQMIFSPKFVSFA